MNSRLEKFKQDFVQLQSKVHGRPLVYLDNAATTLKPKVVVEAVAQHYREEASNVHRGVHYFSELATAKYESTRREVSQFLGAENHEEIIFTSGTTASINLVAHSFTQAFMKPGDEILISQMEHHSNIVPWQLVCERFGYVLKVIPMDERGVLDQEAFLRLLTPRVKLLSVVYVSNSLGTINPVKEMTTAAKAVGAKVLIDAAQAAAHLPINVQDIGCDFLALSAHKLFGPTGVGVLYGRQELLDKMPPFMGGGDMIRTVSFEGSTFAAAPYRFEAGTPNIGGVIGMGAAVRYLRQLPFAEIAEREHELLAYATEQVRAIPGARIIGEAPSKASILAFTLADVHPHDIGSIVDSEGVAIRTGHHCCQPVMDFFGVPATARISIAFYNSRTDINAAVMALHRAREIFA